MDTKEYIEKQKVLDEIEECLEEADVELSWTAVQVLRYLRKFIKTMPVLSEGSDIYHHEEDKNMINKMINNANIYGLEESIRAAKFPMSVDLSKLDGSMTNGIRKLAQSAKGEGHDNWLQGVVVQFDLTATNKFWVEMERYHFINFVSSQSTMHRIAKFNLDEAYCEYVDPRMIYIMKEKVAAYNQFAAEVEAHPSDGGKADLAIKYLEILYSNPAGFKLTARMTTNYRQLKTIYAQRRNHRLPEWRMFCEWIKTLPMSELIVGEE